MVEERGTEVVNWIQKKLGDILIIKGGGTPSTLDKSLWDGDINWFTPTEIGESMYVHDSKRKITALGLEKSSANMLPAKKTILFTSRASIGDVAIISKDSSTNQGFQSLIIPDDLNIFFVYFYSYRIKK